ncbi:hypothetical protein NPX99_08535 [Bartonella sp. 220]|uniref:hypothetical protein n=1 Tax=Bartonella sp. 220B TaxID=2967260 RepID=UPI0022A97A9E|nr:hypothetical protein [Bartonella sp. 220B]MCZ2159280.1 hypothetical protein [Bartonella sp. 220B]
MTSENTEQAPPVKQKWIPPRAGIGRVKGIPNKNTHYTKKHNKVNSLYAFILFESP